MRRWGVTQACVLCGEINETRDNLFFVCPYSFMIWATLTEKLLGSRLNPDWTRTLNSLMRNRLNKHDAMLAKLAFQAAVYWIWRERNGRRHQRPPNSIQCMTHTIRVEIHNRLLALRRNSNDDEGEKLLLRWTEVT